MMGKAPPIMPLSDEQSLVVLKAYINNGFIRRAGAYGGTAQETARGFGKGNIIDSLIVYGMLSATESFNVYQLTDKAFYTHCFCKTCLDRARKKTFVVLDVDTEPDSEPQSVIRHTSVRKYPEFL